MLLCSPLSVVAQLMFQKSTKRCLLHNVNERVAQLMFLKTTKRCLLHLRDLNDGVLHSTQDYEYHDY